MVVIGIGIAVFVFVVLLCAVSFCYTCQLPTFLSQFLRVGPSTAAVLCRCPASHPRWFFPSSSETCPRIYYTELAASVAHPVAVSATGLSGVLPPYTRANALS